MNQPTRVCIDCQQTRPIQDFIKDKYKKSGYKSVCYVCARLRRNPNANVDLPRGQRVANPLSRAEQSRKWAAENPERRREIDRKSRKKNAAKKAQKQREYSRANPHIRDEWEANNPDKVRANWAKRSERLRAAGKYPLTRKEKNRLAKSACFYCGSVDKVSVDHLIPISRGGLNSVGNLVPACLSCNMSKHSKTVTEWIMWRKRSQV